MTAKINTLIFKEISEGSKLTENKKLLRFVQDQIPTSEDLFKDKNFNKKLESKIKSLIDREVKESSNLKKNSNLIKLIQEEKSSVKEIVDDKSFVTAIEDKIEQSSKLEEITSKLSDLDTYIKEKFKSPNIEIAKLNLSKKKT